MSSGISSIKTVSDAMRTINEIKNIAKTGNRELRVELDHYRTQIGLPSFEKETEISEISKQKLDPSSSDSNYTLPCTRKFESLNEAYKSLVGKEYVSSQADVIESWVYGILRAAEAGNDDTVKKYLGAIECFHPENQEAILATAHALAQHAGHRNCTIRIRMFLVSSVVLNIFDVRLKKGKEEAVAATEKSFTADVYFDKFRESKYSLKYLKIVLNNSGIEINLPYFGKVV